MNPNQPYVRFIANDEHYNNVLSKVAGVRRSLWIGTADIKDLHVKFASQTIPFLEVLAMLLRRGVEIRMIHAKEPGPVLLEEFDRFPIVRTGLERMLCPRVHFKMLIFDYEVAYVGSANLTGAGIGMKSNNRRNFEAGIITNESILVNACVEQFDSVWRGAHCSRCGRKKFCPAPVR